MMKSLASGRRGRRFLHLGLAALALLMAGAVLADSAAADHKRWKKWHHGHGHGHHHNYYYYDYDDDDVVYVPQPIYVQPRPIYVRPRPVYEQPPVYYSAPLFNVIIPLKFD
jgi:hypothetical protein